MSGTRAFLGGLLCVAALSAAAHAVTADATLTFDTGTSPLVVVCDGSASIGTNLTYTWQFSDTPADTATGVMVAHRYENAGAVLLSLTVSDGANSDTAYYAIDVDGNLMVVNTTGGEDDNDDNTEIHDTMLMYYTPVTAPENAEHVVNDGARNFGELRVADDSYVKNDPTHGDISYDGYPMVKFDQTLVPAALTINGAYMDLFCSNVDGPNPRNVVAYQVTETWNVKKTCFNYTDNVTGNPPVWWNPSDTAFDPVPSVMNDDFDQATAVTQSGGEVTVGEFTRWDISTIFDTWYGGTANNGVVLLAETNLDEIKFRSRNWTTIRQRPRFVIDYDNTDAAAIQVIEPDGAETYAQNGEITVYWASSGVAGTVDIEIVDTSGAGTVQTVTGVTNDGEHTFTITGFTPGGNVYKIEVSDDSTSPTVEDDSSTTFSIEALPTVTVTLVNDAEEAGPVSGEFEVARTGSTAADLVVDVTVTSTATPTVDFAVTGVTTGVTTTVTIPTGSSTATVYVVPVDDAVSDSGETVTLTVIDDLDAVDEYVPGASATADCTIVDDDIPPATFDLTGPGNNATDEGVPVTFTWLAATGAASYTLLVVETGDSMTPANAVLEVTVTTLTYTAAVGELEYETDYDWRVTATNVAGSTNCNLDFAFTTEVDFDAPTVSATSPADGETGVDIAPAIVVVFNEAMDPSTADAITVTDATGTVVLTTDPVASAGDTTFTCTPLSDLAHEATYTVTIDTTAIDASANANQLTDDYEFTFTIGALISGLVLGEPCGVLDGASVLMLLAIFALVPGLRRRAALASERN